MFRYTIDLIINAVLAFLLSLMIVVAGAIVWSLSNFIYEIYQDSFLVKATTVVWVVIWLMFNAIFPPNDSSVWDEDEDIQEYQYDPEEKGNDER